MHILPFSFARQIYSWSDCSIIERKWGISIHLSSLVYQIFMNLNGKRPIMDDVKVRTLHYVTPYHVKWYFLCYCLAIFIGIRIETWTIQCFIIDCIFSFLFFISVWLAYLILTLTPLNFTKYYCRKCKNWSETAFVNDTQSIHIRKCCQGSVTGLACYGWVTLGGTTPVDGVSFK